MSWVGVGGLFSQGRVQGPPRSHLRESKTDLAVSTDFRAPLQSFSSAEFLRVPYSSSTLQRPALPGLRMQSLPRLRCNWSLPSTCQTLPNGVFLSSALMTSASRGACCPKSPNTHTLGPLFPRAPCYRLCNILWENPNQLSAQPKANKSTKEKTK